MAGIKKREQTSAIRHGTHKEVRDPILRSPRLRLGSDPVDVPTLRTQARTGTTSASSSSSTTEAAAKFRDQKRFRFRVSHWPRGKFYKFDEPQSHYRCASVPPPLTKDPRLGGAGFVTSPSHKSLVSPAENSRWKITSR